MLSLMLLGSQLIGCVDTFDHGTAYDTLDFVCADEAARAALLFQCKEERTNGGDCQGYMSFSGALEGLPVKLTAPIGLQVAALAVEQSTGDKFLRRLDMAGVAPYFVFTFKLLSIGFSPDAIGEFHDLDWEGSELLDRESFTDAFVSGALRIENGKENTAFIPKRGTGFARVGFSEPGLFSVSFNGEFSEGENLEGCLDVFIDAYSQAKEF